MTSQAHVDLQRILAGAQLPALPQSAIRLLQLSQDPENGPAEFAVPIESDPGLTGQVLRFVNSSYFGFRQEISSVKLAISLVGIRTIKNFALWSAVFSLMPNPKCGPFDVKRLWQDSLRRAIFARTFGKLVGYSESEDLFAASLLQDMAIPLLAKELPSQYQTLLDAREGGAERLSELEHAEFGWTHAEAGGMVARVWGLPDTFAAMIETHTDLETLTAGPTDSGLSTVVLSSLLPTVCDDSWNERERFLALYENLASPNVCSLAEIFERVDTQYTEFAPVLKLATPAQALVDRLGPEAVVS
jgi:HD-like signal output (HDOD) protein